MKRYLNIFGLLAIVLLVGTSCEKKITTWDESDEYTYYVDIRLAGQEVILLPVGSTFEDPGFTAFEGETDVTDSVLVDGSADGSTIGYYEIEYSALNTEGYPSSRVRKVIIYDPDAPATDLTGNWTGTRIGRGGGLTTITKLAPGIFECSDFFGGYYEYVAAYGPAYRLKSYIQLFADNTYEALSTSSPWGPWGVLNGVYDPAGGGVGTMSHTVDYGGFQFDVKLTFNPE